MGFDSSRTNATCSQNGQSMVLVFMGLPGLIRRDPFLDSNSKLVRYCAAIAGRYLFQAGLDFRVKMKADELAEVSIL